MKNKSAMTITFAAGFSIALFLSGCENITSSKRQENNAAASVLSAHANENASETTASTDFSDTAIDLAEDTIAIQEGPYGKISLSIPEGWDFETFPIDNGQLTMGMYGIRFYPKEVTNGYIELDYIDNFGVCGTGLKEEQTVIAKTPAAIGTYDDNMYWDFISFQEDYKGIVALTYHVDDWWKPYQEQIMDILNTLSFDSSIKEGGAYVYSSESYIDKIRLSFSLQNISSTGATLVFDQENPDVLTGDLEYGDDFVLEIQKDDIWEEAPIILEDDYGFHDISYVISPKGTSKQDLNWEWLYGKLTPGTYRIQKNLMDFRAPGDYDEYIIYAQFILN